MENGFPMRFEPSRGWCRRDAGVPSPCPDHSMPLEVENPCVPPAAPRNESPDFSLEGGMARVPVGQCRGALRNTRKSAFPAVRLLLRDTYATQVHGSGVPAVSLPVKPHSDAD